VSLRHDDRLSKPYATADPLVLLVFAQAMHAEIHSKAPLVDLVYAEDPRERVEGAGAQDRRRAVAQAIRSRSRGADKSKPRAGEVGNRLAPRPLDNANVNGLSPEVGSDRAVQADVLRNGGAVGKRERQHSLLVEARNDLLEDAEPLAVHEAVVLV